MPPAIQLAAPRLVLLIAVGCVVSARPCVAADRPDRPNVVVIVADDLGYADLGIHGCRDIPTPHIDSLGTDGVRCSQGYVSAPQCSPARAGLLTGRYQQRFGHEHNSALPDSALPLTETTLAARLRAAGYATGLVGKWHLGTDDAHHPLNRGFQEFFGFLGGANPYLPVAERGTVPRIMRGREEAAEREYLTDAFAREGVAFIDRHQQEPFFLYLAFNAPHGPLQATEAYLAHFAAIEDEKRRTYAAMVFAMDAAVGRVLQKLRATQLEANTLIFFISDNGGPTAVNASRNDPLRGVKGEVREGGIRVPFLVQWKGRLPAGRLYEHPVMQLDICPTALAAADVRLPNDADLDGANLLPYLSGERAHTPHELLYWRFSFPPNQSDKYKRAIRQGKWKWFTDIGGKDEPRPAGGNLKLVDLTADVRETRDLAEQYPDKAKSLERAWKEWNAELPEPTSQPPKRRVDKRSRAERRP